MHWKRRRIILLEKTHVCLNDLRKRRDEIKAEIDKQFDKMKMEAEDQMKEMNTVIENEIAALDENLNLVSRLKQSTDDGDDNVMDITETLSGVKEMLNLFKCDQSNHPRCLSNPVALPTSHLQQF